MTYLSKMNIRYIISSCLLTVAAVAAAQLPQNSGGLYAELAADTVTDGSSAEIRIDPVIAPTGAGWQRHSAARPSSR